MYGTRDEAERRLHNTIVGFDGLPVHVVDVQGGRNIRVGFRVHPYGESSDVVYEELDDPRFNRFETLPLGFVNYFDRSTGLNTAYAERLPVRRQKQGISNENLNTATLIGGIRLDYTRVTRSDAFVEMVTGVYPTMTDALEHMIPGSSVAVSREYAIHQSESGMLSLYWRREQVGIIFKGEIYVQPGRQYLTESIIECPNLPDRVEVL